MTNYGAQLIPPNGANYLQSNHDVLPNKMLQKDAQYFMYRSEMSTNQALPWILEFLGLPF